MPKGSAFDCDLFNVLYEFDFSLIFSYGDYSNQNFLPMLAAHLAQDPRANPNFVRIKI